MVDSPGPERTISQSVKGKSWSELKQMAAKLGEKESRSNKFKLIDEAFRKIKPKMAKLKNRKNICLMYSRSNTAIFK